MNDMIARNIKTHLTRFIENERKLLIFCQPTISKSKYHKLNVFLQYHNFKVHQNIEGQLPLPWLHESIFSFEVDSVFSIIKYYNIFFHLNHD